MKITWLGTASLWIESNGTRLLFDPYLKSFSAGLPPFPLDKISDADAILITHPHLDHFADMPAVMQVCPAPVYVCPRGIELAREQGFDLERIHPIGAHDILTIGNIIVRAYPSRHCHFDRPLVRHTVARVLKPENLHDGLSVESLNLRYSIDADRDVYAYEVLAERKSIFILGSAGCQDNEDYPSGMDLLVYPYQGRSEMAAYSMPFLNRFRPKRVMLDHFDDAFPPVSATMDCDEFVNMAKKTHPDLEIIVPKEMCPIEV